MSTCLDSLGCGETSISLYAGRDRAIRVTVLADIPIQGSPLDLTGAKIWFGVKHGTYAPDEDALILKRNALAGGGDDSIFSENPETGVFVIYIYDNETIDMGGERYIYDIVVETADGNKIEVVRPSEFNVMKIVVRAEDEEV